LFQLSVFSICQVFFQHVSSSFWEQGLREKSYQGGTKTDAGPPYFIGALVEACTVCLYSDQNQLSCYDLQID